MTSTNRSGDDHYKILGLNKNCTTKEVRDAFVSLSKIHHPDRHSNDKESHKKFVKINEAYTVLSKPISRRTYDNTVRSQNARNVAYGSPFAGPYRYNRGSPDPDPDESYQYQQWNDETFRRATGARTDRGRFYTVHDANSYYGVKGYPRRPHSYVVGGAFLLMGFGVILHWMAYKYSTAFSLARMDRQQAMYAMNLKKSREAAMDKGTEAQIDEIGERLMAASTRKPF